MSVKSFEDVIIDLAHVVWYLISLDLSVIDLSMVLTASVLLMQSYLTNCASILYCTVVGVSLS